MSKNNLNKAANAAIKNEGILPYDQHTAEQRRQFLGRVKLLLHSSILSESLRENYKFAAGAVPENPNSKELKILSNKLKRTQKNISAIIPYAKSIEQDLSDVLASSERGKEQIQNTSWKSYNLLQLILSVSDNKFPDAITAVQEVIMDKQKEPDENQMIDFGQYCADLIKSGRKSITKNDYKKFLNKK